MTFNDFWVSSFNNQIPEWDEHMELKSQHLTSETVAVTILFSETFRKEGTAEQTPVKRKDSLFAQLEVCIHNILGLLIEEYIRDVSALPCS